MMRLPAIVVQLAKAPVEGRVKTRMLPVLSPARCVALHQFLTVRVLQNLICNPSSATQPTSMQWDYELSCDRAHPFFDELNAKYTPKLSQQHDGDLGQRLQAIQLAHPSKITVLIGSDCPFLRREDIEALIEALRSELYDIALIPAHDGGYVALACSGAYPVLFNNIDWGSERVFAQTLVNADEAALRVRIFEPKHDIDRPEDLALIPDFK